MEGTLEVVQTILQEPISKGELWKSDVCIFSFTVTNRGRRECHSTGAGALHLGVEC